MSVAALERPPTLCLNRRQSFMPDCTALSIPVKTCTNCGATYPASTDFFHRQKNGLHGLQSQCKICLNKKKHTKRLAAKIAETKPGDPIMHKTCGRCGRLLPATEKYFYQQGDRFMSWCKTCNSEYGRLYRQEHAEELKEYDKRRYPVRRAKQRKYHRRWQRANTVKVKAYHQQRRARRAAADGNHTDADIKRQYNMQNGKCWYCLASVGDNYHVDHVVPLSRGGTNGPGNIVIACPTCNLSKGAKLPSEFSGRLF